MRDLDTAKNLLQEYTCVLVKDSSVYGSTKTGIAPMLDFLSQDLDLSGFSAADKIVGKAAAMLFVLAGVKEVYGQVMSRAAQAFLQSHGISCSCDTLTEHIINRKGDDICPMEKTVQNMDDPATAFSALLQTRKRLQAQIK